MTIQELKEKFAPDQEAQNAIWCHGCDICQIEDIQKGIGNIGEICVTKLTDKTHFQNMGVLVKGKVTLMAKFDIGSKYDPITKERTVYLGQLKDPSKVFVKKYSELQNEEGSYTESFVIPQEVIGVFVLDFILERSKRFQHDREDLEDLYSLGLPVTVISTK